jgi:hypothetical protein
VPVAAFAWVLVVAGVGALVWFGWRYVGSGASVEGISDGEIVTPSALAQRDVTVSVRGDAATARVRLNGQDLPGVVVQDGSTLRFRLPTLVDGRYELAVTSDRRPVGKITTRTDFVVDGTPPAMDFATLTPAVSIDQPVVVQGTIKDAVEVQAPGAKMTRDGDNVKLSFDAPPIGPVNISAVDAAGNRVVATVIVPVKYPETRGVHVGAEAWADPATKAEILQMIADGRINTVELDLKDEQGDVGYGSDVPLAQEIGAVKARYDLRAAVDELHGLGVRVVGRVVAFLDPKLSRAAWARGDKDWVLQRPDGQPLGDGGFTNYVQPDVRAFILAFA